MGIDPNKLDDEQNPEEEQESSKEPEPEWAKQLRKENRSLKKELTSLRPLKDTNAFLMAGLGELSDDHKTALRAVVGDDLTPENLSSKAKSLGFVSEESQASQDAKQIEQEVKSVQQTEKAVSSSSAQPEPVKDFTTRIREAKTPQEVLAIVAESGEEHHLLVETD